MVRVPGYAFLTSVLRVFIVYVVLFSRSYFIWKRGHVFSGLAVAHKSSSPRAAHNRVPCRYIKYRELSINNNKYGATIRYNIVAAETESGITIATRDQPSGGPVGRRAAGCRATGLAAELATSRGAIREKPNF